MMDCDIQITCICEQSKAIINYCLTVCDYSNIHYHMVQLYYSFDIVTVIVVF